MKELSTDDLAELDELIDEIEEEESETETPEKAEQETAEVEPEKPKAKKKKASSSSQDRYALDPEQFGKDVRIIDTDLNECFMNQAPLNAHYGAVWAYANAKYNAAKFTLGVLESEIDAELREEAESEGKKVTEASITKAIRLDSRLITANKKLIDLELKANLAKQNLDSFRQRRDMLIQCGADAREGMKGSMRMNGPEGTRQASIDKANSRSA